MERKSSEVAQRVWKMLRLALLWARKGGVFKRRLMVELRVVPKFLKSLGHTSAPRSRFHYGERQLSFDETPIFHFNIHRPPPSLRFSLFPCISPPQVDFDYDFDLDCASDNQDLRDREEMMGEEYVHEGDDCEETKGIDLRAEEFIAKFYDQMKLQRQISYLQYNEMLKRGTN